MPLELCYSYRALGRLINKDRRWVQRVLTAGHVFPRHDKIWISDIRKQLPEFLESFADMLHQQKMIELASDPEDFDE